jgi:hypothetical protein
MNWDSSANKVSGLGLDDRGSTVSRGSDFYTLQDIYTDSGALPISYPTGTVGSSTELKRT